MEKANALLKKELPEASEDVRNKIRVILIHDMLGLGHIEFLLNDGNLEEIVVNTASEPVWVYHKKHGWLKTNVFIGNEAETVNYSSIIARRVGKQITILTPLLDAHLVTGDRANATLFPISSKGNTITIRRFRRDPWTVTDFIKASTASVDVMALVWLAMQYESNIIVSGGTGSGKTSLLNVLMPFIPPNHRIVTIEDSVSGEAEILYEYRGKVFKSTVGELVDGLAEDDSIEDCMLENENDIRIPSMNPQGRIEWSKPSHFIRHRVKKDLLKITLKSGKTIEVTPDHSLFTLNTEGHISSVSGLEVKEGTWLATPRKVEWKGTNVAFDLRPHLNDLETFKGCFVKSLEIRPILQACKAPLLRRFPKATLNNAIRKNLASVEMLQLADYTPQSGWICSRLGTKIPLDIEVDEDLATFAGLWLADGCYDKNSTLVSIVEPEARVFVERVAERFGVRTKMHSDGITLMINSKPLKQFFQGVMGLDGNAYTKKMPSWVFRLEKPLIAAVLCGYFSGDGWVRKNDIAIRSSSKQLLKDVQTLLLPFGIPLRVKWKLLKDRTFEAHISTAKFLREFANQVGFVINKKTLACAKWENAQSHDVSDVIPLPKKLYVPLKKVIKNEIGRTRSYYSWKSYLGTYSLSNIGRKTLQNLAVRYVNELPPIYGELAFNDLLWDSVVSVERVPFHGFVYDFSVPGNESFVCDNVVCHNTREIQIPEFLHWVPLTTREPNAEGKGGVNMLDLLVNSLRMRPDRIVVGEIRRQREAEVMFEAMHTGHSTYTTVHANTAEETIRRLISPPIEVPVSMLEAVHLNVVMYRNRRMGMRRILQVAEFIPEKSGSESNYQLKPNILYRWKANGDRIEKYSESIRLNDELNLHTGLNASEIAEDLADRRRVLEWMVKNDIRSIGDVGRVMAQYYHAPDEVIKMARSNAKLPR
ncbi:MAG: Flp pilus assembly complex ATPase component TadA [Candidatus Diapherotrites archaeon]|nr:Flp pilus assembly complex ATPase component TadA [Candidatus Diapherotrites archaeon]